MSGPVSVTYEPEWRSEAWSPEIPSRPAWFVACTIHPELGKDWAGRPWGYLTSGRANGVATRHRCTKHALRVIA